MRSRVTIDWSIKKNLRYMIALFVFFYIVPFVIMNLPQFPEADPINWTVEGGFTTARICFVLIWIGVPLSGGIVALWHVLAGGSFCPILIIEAALAMPLYLLGMDAGLVLVLSFSVIIVLAIECFALPGGCTPPTEGEKPYLLAGAAKDRKFLALLCFWSVAMLGVIQIAGCFLALWYEIIGPANLLPLPLILFLLPLFRLKDLPLSAGGLVGVLILFALSALLSASFYMNRLWRFHLFFVALGFAMLLLMVGLITLIKFVSQKRRRVG